MITAAVNKERFTLLSELKPKPFAPWNMSQQAKLWHTFLRVLWHSKSKYLTSSLFCRQRLIFAKRYFSVQQLCFILECVMNLSPDSFARNDMLQAWSVVLVKQITYASVPTIRWLFTLARCDWAVQGFQHQLWHNVSLLFVTWRRSVNNFSIIQATVIYANSELYYMYPGSQSGVECESELSQFNFYDDWWKPVFIVCTGEMLVPM